MAARRALEWIKRQRPVWFLDMKYQTWFNKPGNPRVCHLQFQHGGRAGKSCLVQWCTSTLGWHVEEWHILSYTHYQGVFDPHVCEHATNESLDKCLTVTEWLALGGLLDLENCPTPPYVYLMSRCITARDRFTRSSPMLEQQTKMVYM